MLFTHDTEVALVAAAALVNTGHEPETLPDVDALDAFARYWEWSGQRLGDSVELRQVQALRPRIERLWHSREDDAVAIVNELLAEFDALPQLVKHDGWDYHLHATSAVAPLAARMAVEAAMAFTDVIRIKALGRLRVCAAADCDDVLVDLSKNRSRRFCETTCANRTNTAAYRARQARG